MDPWYRIVIPTRDSAAWIGAVIDHYRARGVAPVIAIDTRTKDSTRQVVERHGAEAVDLPAFSFTESIVAITRGIVATPWALFVHDDEMPSDALFARLAGPQPPDAVQSVAIPRRWAWYEPGRPLCYGRSDHWRDRAGDNGADHHWRLFRPGAVTFVSKMHSDGFLIDRWSRMPPEAYIVHFEWIIRSRGQRAAKLRRYDRMRFGYGKFFANMYLPEDQPPGIIDYIPFETDAFDRLARVYYGARGPETTEQPLTLGERWARFRNMAETRLGLAHHARTPGDRIGLAPRPEAEIADPANQPPVSGT
jgi:hypothetical protein